MQLGSRSGTSMSEINVTPMVDVMLVLLVIFMVTAPFLEERIKVHLPEAGTGQRWNEHSSTITLAKNRTLYFNNSVVTFKQLRQKLDGLEKNQPVLIRSDRSIPMGRIVEIWDICRTLGISDVHIATESDRG